MFYRAPRALGSKELGNLRRPSFSGLDREQGEHGRRHVVVVELLTLPDPRQDLRREVVGGAEHEVLAPGRRMHSVAT